MYPALVARRLDNTIQWISVNKINHAIHWRVIYPVDNVIQPSQEFKEVWDYSLYTRPSFSGGGGVSQVNDPKGRSSWKSKNKVSGLNLMNLMTGRWQTKFIYGVYTDV